MTKKTLFSIVKFQLFPFILFSINEIFESLLQAANRNEASHNDMDSDSITLKRYVEKQKSVSENLLASPQFVGWAALKLFVISL